MNYALKESVEIEFRDNELFIIDSETGFVGTGNNDAYQVLDLLSKGLSLEDVIRTLKEQHKESQYPRIEKSVPKIIEWAVEREIIREI